MLAVPVCHIIVAILCFAFSEPMSACLFTSVSQDEQLKTVVLAVPVCHMIVAILCFAFSEPMSAACLKRPPCTKYDYFEFQTPCNDKNQV